MGTSCEEAYYYTVHVKKICDALPNDAVEAVIVDVMNNHNGDFIGYFFREVGKERVWTGHDEKYGEIVTFKTTELQSYLNSYFKKDIRWRDIEAAVGLIINVAAIVVSIYLTFTFISAVAGFMNGIIDYYAFS